MATGWYLKPQEPTGIVIHENSTETATTYGQSLVGLGFNGCVMVRFWPCVLISSLIYPALLR